MGVIVSRDKATLLELQEQYTLQDALDLYEVIAVDNHNERVHLAQAKSRGRSN